MGRGADKEIPVAKRPDLQRQVDYLHLARGRRTYKQIAALCGVSPSAYQKWEHGEFPIAAERLASMAAGLGTTEAHLAGLRNLPTVGEVGEPTPVTFGDVLNRIRADAARLERAIGDRLDWPINGDVRPLTE